MTERLKRKRASAGAAALGAMWLAASSGMAQPHAPQPAHLRWVHACGEAGSVRLELAGQQLGPALEFGQASNYYPGAAQAQSAGAFDLHGEILLSALRLEARAFYTVVLWGSRQQPALLVLEDRLPQAAGSGAIRWVHAAQGAPGLELRSELGIRLLPQLEAGKVADYRSVPVGTYGLKVTAPGETEALAEIGAQTFRAGGAYTFVVAREGERYRLIALRDR